MNAPYEYAKLANKSTADCAPSITSECDTLEKALAELHEVISKLESTIAPVTRPAMPVPCGVNAAESACQSSALLERIQRFRANTYNAVSRIGELAQRVEL